MNAAQAVARNTWTDMKLKTCIYIRFVIYMYIHTHTHTHTYIYIYIYYMYIQAIFSVARSLSFPRACVRALYTLTYGTDM